MNTSNKLAALGGAAALAVMTLAGCRPTHHDCEDIDIGSRPLWGACLPEEFEDLDELRESCPDGITKVTRKNLFPCIGETDKAKVWTCAEESSEQ